MSPDRSQAAYAASAADLALRALDALQGAGGTAMVADHVERTDDPKAALAAIRIVGADVFAPCLLAGEGLHPADAAAVAQSFAVFPPPVSTPAPPPAGAAEPWLAAWRDWGTASLLARFAGTDTGAMPVGTDADGIPAAAEGTERNGPVTAGVAGALAPRPTGAPQLAEAGSDPAETTWQTWSTRMGQLSPLALPGLESPVHAMARAAPQALARGATRAVLRRDFPTAARVARWLALLAAEGEPLPLDPAPLVEHLRLHGGGPRLALDVAIARRLLGVEDV
ncbi:hypothetical protein GPA10_12525 [Streptomyces sp. p1417]|uniref:Uncharacterized protein n=1 Tax=Streptomyces typhae TaxID=2681492 RepID=A0A6L6WTG9_9ACTN|nr:hypothetical protein [Streptomyces typhae]